MKAFRRPAACGSILVQSFGMEECYDRSVVLDRPHLVAGNVVDVERTGPLLQQLSQQEKACGESSHLRRLRVFSGSREAEMRCVSRKRRRRRVRQDNLSYDVDLRSRT